MDDDVVICRCMEVTYGDVLRAIEDGAETVAGVKKRVGSGMGVCQGEYCGRVIAEIIAEKTGIPRSQILPDTQRPPVRPISAAAFLESPCKMLEENL